MSEPWRERFDRSVDSVDADLRKVMTLLAVMSKEGSIVGIGLSPVVTAMLGISPERLRELAAESAAMKTSEIRPTVNLAASKMSLLLMVLMQTMHQGEESYNVICEASRDLADKALARLRPDPAKS